MGGIDPNIQATGAARSGRVRTTGAGSLREETVGSDRYVKIDLPAGTDDRIAIQTFSRIKAYCQRPNKQYEILDQNGDAYTLEENEDGTLTLSVLVNHPGAIYEPTTSSRKLESNSSYLDIVRSDSADDQKSDAIEQRKAEFARQIFDALQGGLLSEDVAFDSPMYAILTTDVGDGIQGLITDSDMDGYFEIDINKLFTYLKDKNAFSNSSITKQDLKLKLSGIGNYYFNSVGNTDVLKFMGKVGAPWFTGDIYKNNVYIAQAESMLNTATTRAYDNSYEDGILVEYQKTALPNLEILEETGFIDMGMDPYNLEEVSGYFQDKYSGNLSNPETRQEFAKEMTAYLKAFYTGGFDEDGEQVSVHDGFYMTSDGIARMAKDRYGRPHIDCGGYMQLTQKMFAAVGLDTQAYGTAIQVGEKFSGHVQVAGFPPDASFQVVGNNSRVEVFDAEATDENITLSMRSMISHDIGYPVMKVYPGLETQAEVAEALVEDMEVLTARAAYSDAIAYYVSTEGSRITMSKPPSYWEQVLETNMKIEIQKLEAAGQPVLGFPMQWRMDPQGAMLSTLDRFHTKFTNGIDALDSAEAALTQIQEDGGGDSNYPMQIPMKVTITNADRSTEVVERVITFNSYEEAIVDIRAKRQDLEGLLGRIERGRKLYERG